MDVQNIPEGAKNEKIKLLIAENRTALLAADSTTPVLENGICFDGIIDEAEFEHQSKKILFLLKETNGVDSSGKLPERLQDWSYRDWLQYNQANGGRSDDPSEKFYGKTFYNLCMWVDVFYQCLTEKNVRSFDEYYTEFFNVDHYREILKKTAIVNLKKNWGGSSTKWGDLNQYLEIAISRDVLKQEIEIIKPDIVVCGGRQVFDFAQKIFETQEDHLPIAGGEACNYFQHGTTIFLDFYHPSCRKSRRNLYYYAVKRFEVLKSIF